MRMHNQRTKKILSDSPGPVDFAIGLVNSITEEQKVFGAS